MPNVPIYNNKLNCQNNLMKFVCYNKVTFATESGNSEVKTGNTSLLSELNHVFVLNSVLFHLKYNKQ